MRVAFKPAACTSSSNQLYLRSGALLSYSRETGACQAAKIDPEGEVRVRVSFWRETYQLRAADPTYAAQCLVHWRQFLRGPPNRPHRDPFGLLECVSNYLSLCASAGPGHFGMGAGHGPGGVGGGVKVFADALPLTSLTAVEVFAIELQLMANARKFVGWGITGVHSSVERIRKQNREGN